LLARKKTQLIRSEPLRGEKHITGVEKECIQGETGTFRDAGQQTGKKFRKEKKKGGTAGATSSRDILTKVKKSVVVGWAGELIISCRGRGTIIQKMALEAE